MILVTGGTGFVGKALVRSLTSEGYPVRLLLRPSPRSPELPKGVPVEVAVSSLNDERGLRAAMMDVEIVYHLASAERLGAYGSLLKVDIQGTRAIARAAADAGVQRIFYLSHLGADRASAYPVMKAKAIAEEFIRRSGVDYTIVRSAVAYGPGDGFTAGLGSILNALPQIFFVPGDGRALIQPIWVEDLATCLAWALDQKTSLNEMFEVGGPEYFQFSQVVEMVMRVMGMRRRLVYVKPPYLRAVTVVLEALFPRLPVNVYWLDYLATNRTCALDTLPRVFNLLPARMNQRLDYLRHENWRQLILRALLSRR